MADYYNQFSEVVFGKLTDEEAQWVDEMLAMDPEEDLDRQQIEKFMPGAELDEWWPGFECSVVGDGLWLRAGESFSPENVTAFLRWFIRRFRPTAVVTLTWASSCSKLRAGDFGGGWAAVSAHEITMGSTWDAAREAAERLPDAPMENRAAYLEAGGSFCPFCKSTDISGASMTFESGGIEQKVTCEACGKTWFDVYRLVEVEER